MVPEPIAIIGTGMRLPGKSTSLDKLWSLLESKADVSRKVDRFNIDAHYHPDADHQNTTNVKEAYLLQEDTTVFDNEFFSISALEAMAMDPQQRILLEVVYEALESAGQRMTMLKGSDTSVFVGLFTGDYHEINIKDLEDAPTYLATGTGRSIVSNRISYFFDWHGPSATIDTACSSSLVALHQAVTSLRQNESSMAVAAGTNLIYGSESFISESTVHMLSPTGRSRMWDSKADGYARGEGVCCLVLKTLYQALKDGDRIDAIIRETGVNQDGRTNGITMPNDKAQIALLERVYSNAEIKPETVSYFEAHGTGTPAGDPIEANAIRSFYAHRRPSKKEPLRVGSIKTNIGHLEGAAGIAGILKVLSAFKKGKIPGNLHFESLNPAIGDIAGLELPTTECEWPSTFIEGCGHVRRASVNSFGYGGTNGHVILESFDEQHCGFSAVTEPAPLQASNPAQFYTLPFSSAGKASLANLVKSFSVLAGSQTLQDHLLPDLAFTLDTRREHFAHRCTITVDSLNSLAEKAKGDIAILKAPTYGAQIGLIWIFTGQGGQHWSMARNLIRYVPHFRESLERSEKYLEELADGPSWSLVGELLAATEGESNVASSAFSQPLCSAVQLALVDLWKALNVKPDAVIGHSSGEIGAAYAAGVIDAQDAIRIAYYRGKHMSAIKSSGRGGGMLAVGLSEDLALELVLRPEYEQRICVAAVNSPSSCTLSGDREVLVAVKERLDQDKIFARMLLVDTAYHCKAHLQSCTRPYLASLEQCGVKARTPHTTWYSSVTMKLVQSAADVQPSYWIENMVSSVQFRHAVESTLQTLGNDIHAIVELGPHPALQGPVKQIMKAAPSVQGAAYFASIKRHEDDRLILHQTAGSLWSLGFDVNLRALNELTSSLQCRDFARRPLGQLPSYAWNHSTSHWNESRLSRRYRFREVGKHDLLGVRSNEDFHQLKRWKNRLRLKDIPWVEGHKVQGAIIFPAAGYISMALEALRSTLKQEVSTFELTNVDILNAIVLGGTKPIETQLVLKSISNKGGKFTIYSCQDSTEDIWQVNCSGQIEARITPIQSDNNETLRVQNEFEGLVEHDVRSYYRQLSLSGLEYGPTFQGIVEIHSCESASHGIVELPYIEGYQSKSLLHPTLLDSCFQSMFPAIPGYSPEAAMDTFVPTRIERLQVSSSFASEVLSVDTRMFSRSSNRITADLDAFDTETDQLVFSLQGLSCSLLGKSDKGENQIRSIVYCNYWKKDIEQVKLLELSADSEDGALAEQMEELSLRFMRVSLGIFESLPQEKRDQLEWHFLSLRDWYQHVVSRAATGELRGLDKLTVTVNNADEDLARIQEIVEDYRKSGRDEPDMELIIRIGDSMANLLNGETTALEVLRRNDYLDRYYQESLGLREGNNLVGQAVKGIVHRYPRARWLEIGAGTGGTTQAVLNAAGCRFEHYCFTDISPGFFPVAKAKFSNWNERISYKVLDIEKSPEEQGFRPGSYDCIVASNVLHATQDLERTMRHTRTLLKPGGFLLLLEVTGSTLRVGFIMSPLPGWWLGKKDGRQFAPTIDEKRWDSVLQKTGWSGIEMQQRDSTNSDFYLTTFMLSRATSDKFEPVLKPLEHASSVIGSSKGVLIIGGSNDQDTLSQLFTDLGKLRGRRVSRIPSLSFASVHAYDLSGWDVILLLDDSEFDMASLDKESLSSLQNVLLHSRTVIWTSRGGLESPISYSNIGFSRSVRHENPSLKLVNLDVDPAAPPEVFSNSVIQTLVRAIAGRAAETTEILWSSEPELQVDFEGTTFIPRIRANDEVNSRIAAGSGKANERLGKLDPSMVYEVDRPTEGRPALVEIGAVEHLKTHFTIEFARLCNHKSGWSPSFFAAGTFKGDNAVLYTRGKLATHLPTKESHYVKVPAGISSLDYLALYSDYMLALAFFEHNRIAGKPCRVLIDGIDSSSLAFAFSRVAIESDIEVFGLVRTHYDEDKVQDLADGLQLPRSNLFTVSTGRPRTHLLDFLTKTVGACNFVGYQESSRQLAKYVPAPSHFYELESSDVAYTEHPNIEFHAFNSESILGNTMSRNLDTFSHRAVALIKSSLTMILSSRSPSVLSLAQLDEAFSTHIKPAAAPFLSLKQLKPPSLIRTKRRADAAFRPDATYLLAGFNGGLGRSVTRWMVRDGGARNLVLLSRRGCDTQGNGFVEELRSEFEDLRLEILKADVSSLDDVRHSFEFIDKANWPPLRGVANAAMVLKDTLFADMDIERFRAVLRPKVQGSQILHDVLAGRKLDFFIMFSSLASIVGNRFQSNYGAANAYMIGLARQRKREGLAASVIDIGMITGAGYVAERPEQAALLKQYRFFGISPEEFNSIFHEAVIIGQKTGVDPELITGLESKAKVEKDEIPFWATDPRVSQIVATWEQGETDMGDQDSTSAAASMPLSQQIRAVKSKAALQRVVQDSFKTKVAGLLLMDENTIDPTMNLNRLGIDSLVAVELRTWFYKELAVDIPVLKILSGNSVAQICLTAVQLMGVYTRLSDYVEEAEISSHTKAQAWQHSKSTITASSSASLTTSTAMGREESTAETSVAADSDDSGNDSAAITDPSKAGVALSDHPISFEQGRILFLQQMLDDPSTYNIAMAYRLRGKVDVQGLNRAFLAVIDKHAVLRTALREVDGQARQVIFDRGNFVGIEQLGYINKDDVKTIFEEIRSTHYDLSQRFLTRLAIGTVAKDEHVLFWGIHHIAFDRSSTQPFLGDLIKAYQGVDVNSEVTRSRSYADYARWQRRSAKESCWRDTLDWWRQTLSEAPSVTKLLPFASSTRKAQTNYVTGSVSQRIPRDTVKELDKLCKSIGVNKSHAILSILYMAINRFVSDTDIVVGITDSGRQDLKDAETVGLFVNLLPIRTNLDPEDQFTHFARKVKENMTSALEHSQVPFDLIAAQTGQRERGQNPIFQILYNYQTRQVDNVPFSPDLKASLEMAADARNPYDLVVEWENFEMSSQFSIRFQRYLYQEIDIKVFLECMVRILDQVLLTPGVACSRLVPSPKTDERLSTKGPATDYHFLAQKGTLHSWFRNLVDDAGEEASSRPVFIQDQATMALTQLNDEVETLASWFCHDLGIVQGESVALLIKPSSKYVASMLALARLGAISLPISPSWPAKRVETILEQSHTKFLVHDKRYQELARQFSSNRVVSSTEDATLATKKPILTLEEPKAESPLYCLFTSGTTGTPKGVVVSHGSLVNQLSYIYVTYQIGKHDRVLWQTAPTFDISLDQMFAFLAPGGTVVIANQERDRLDPARIVDLMEEQQVTYLGCTPTEAKCFIHSGLGRVKTLKHAFIAGEIFSFELLNSLQELGLPRLNIYNRYGPTEITISALIEQCRTTYLSGRSVPIGHPIGNYECFVLDSRTKQPVMQGIPGELAIAGIGIAIGYTGNQQSSSPSPFQVLNFEDRQGREKVYCTGDLVRQGVDGSFEVMGRIEEQQQIKIRGVRIELSDISAAVVEASGGLVQDCVSVVRGADVEKHIVSFVLCSARYRSFNSRSIRNSLQLPEVMKPHFIVALDHYPLTSSGKVDTKDLASRELKNIIEQSSDGTEGLPLEGTEKALAALWQASISSSQKLQPKRVDNFFDLGGNSINLIQLKRLIENQMRIKIEVATLFLHPTLQEMAERISGLHTKEKVDVLGMDLDFEFSDVGQKGATRPEESKRGKTVVLTGSTGWIGSHLLCNLLSHPDVSRVILLAVRANKQSEAEERVRSALKDRNLPDNGLLSAKVDIHLGSLESLVDKDTSAIEKNGVDIIIHNGSQVNHLMPYEGLRHANVSSTRALIGLAHRTSASLHYMSSVEVPLLSNSGAQEIFPKRPTTTTDKGYTLTKWVSERLLMAASDNLGIAVQVHRLPNVLGNLNTGRKAPNNDLVVRAIRTLRAYPFDETTFQAKVWDVVSVDALAESVLKLAFLQHRDSRRVVHQVGRPVSLAQIYGRRPSIESSTDSWKQNTDADPEEIHLAQGMLERLRNLSNLPTLDRDTDIAAMLNLPDNAVAQLIDLEAPATHHPV